MRLRNDPHTPIHPRPSVKDIKMGKRSDFERAPRDFYPTPYEAVVPLLSFVSGGFAEPCAGNGDLIRHLENNGLSCQWSSDIEADARTLKRPATQFITNPPWDRKILHPIIDNLRQQAPTWLLFDADWAHTRQAAPYLPYCSHIVSVGRVRWIPGSKMTGKDNCCWYLFGSELSNTRFTGRN